MSVILALLLAAPPGGAAPVAPATVECGRIGRAEEVSFRGHERRLLERVEQITRDERGSVPPPAAVAAAFRTCRDELAKASPADRALAGWRLWQEDSRLHLQVAGREARSLPLSETTPRLAERVVSRLIEDLGLRGDAARAARRTLWFLWFEAYLAAQGHRYDGYTYAAELARTRARDRGKSFSIGVALEVDGSGIVITEVLDAALAAQGVQSGARLAALDDRPVGSLSGADWDAYLLRSAPFDYTLTCVSARPVRGRAIAVRHRSIVWGRLGRAVYAHVRRFSEETEIELRRILRRVTREGASGLILDLRRDPGGRASPGLVDMFLKSGQPILTSAPLRGGEPKSELASVEYYGLPLVLLVDGQTVSMAEVLAAAVRQHQRGLLVGQRTFGKGVGQRVTPVLDEGELALESRIYYYPGTTTTWNAIGIQPDVEVPPAGEALSEMLHAPMLDLERQLSVDEALQVARRRLEEEQ